MTTTPAAPIPSPRPPGPPAPEEPAAATTFTAALEHWNTRRNTPPTDEEAAPGPQLLNQQELPLPPAGIPSQDDLQAIAAAAADQARLLLNGTPLPDTPADHAARITATRPGTPLEPAYRLGLDVGHWRDLVATHRNRHTRSQHHGDSTQETP
ncbi:hypothetical protein ACWC1D_25565 [Streptomyces sp. NPDC001478]